MRLDFRGYREVSLFGNALGYQYASSSLFKALEKDPEVTLTEDAEVAIHFCNPQVFKPVPSKRNFLFTMCETDPAPSYHEDPFIYGGASGQIVPSRFCDRILAPVAARWDVPTAISPLGFDPAKHPITPRSFDPREKFRFLWVGAPNGRKGASPVIRAWDLAFQGQDWCHLTIKTTDPKGEGKVSQLSNSVTFDSRFLPAEEMSALVGESHCAVLPSFGEGFGLCHLEALASGLPVITIRHSAPPEFLKDDALYSDFEMVETKSSDGEIFHAALADRVDLARSMAQVVKAYPKWSKRALRGARRVHSSMTWTDASNNLKEAIELLTQRLDD